jgi:hypothetical protein
MSDGMEFDGENLMIPADVETLLRSIRGWTRVMSGGIKFDGDNLMIPADVKILLRSLAVVSRQRMDTALNFPANEAPVAYLKHMTQITATSSLSISGLLLCPLASPPEPIQGGFDSSNNLRLECLHPNQHCWSLSGIKQGC